MKVSWKTRQIAAPTSIWSMVRPIFSAPITGFPLTNPAGTPVGAVFGYTTMLWKLAEDLHKADGPTHLAVILDKAGKSFRNDIFPAYKANRPPAPEDLVPQFP
jgi:5'-3' exonuclease